MKKYLLIITIFGLLTSFTVHKFYVSIYQINYNQKARRIEITTRIFADDLNTVLQKKYQKKTYLGEDTETAEDIILMQKYLSEKLLIKINNQKMSLKFIQKEMEDNTLICYYTIDKINKIKTLEIQNTALFDLSSDQQNIMQTTVYGTKENKLLTINHSNFFYKY